MSWLLTFAERATMQFFDDIKADTSGAPQALRLLFGVPTLAFAIDTTGSMDDVIDAVRGHKPSASPKGLAGNRQRAWAVCDLAVQRPRRRDQ
jgi:hypothetical protein